MASVNKVILVGNLGADPETRYLTNGDIVANIRLATTESWKDKFCAAPTPPATVNDSLAVPDTTPPAQDRMSNEAILQKHKRTIGAASPATGDAISANVSLTCEGDIPAQAQGEDRKDAERLDWLLKHNDATVCSEGAYGPYFVWFRYSGRSTERFNTQREAIDAAMAAGEPKCE